MSEQMPIYTVKLCNNFNTLEFYTSSLDFDEIERINKNFVKATTLSSENNKLRTSSNSTQKMASEKQMSVIKKFKLSDRDDLTAVEAQKLIKESMEKRG